LGLGLPLRILFQLPIFVSATASQLASVYTSNLCLKGNQCIWKW
jgi:hypothetical protein